MHPRAGRGDRQHGRRATVISAARRGRRGGRVPGHAAHLVHRGPIIDSLADNVSALDLQAATGLLAIIVLLVVMNWFFHKVYWTGWISMHSRRKQELMKERLRIAALAGPRAARILVGLSRGFRGRPLPAELSVEARRTVRSCTGVGLGFALTVDRRRAHVRRAPAAALSPHAGASRA